MAGESLIRQKKKILVEDSKRIHADEREPARVSSRKQTVRTYVLQCVLLK